HNIDFAKCGVFFLAVRQLARQPCAFQHALAARHFARFTSSFASPRRFDDFVAQRLGVVGVLEQPGFKCARYSLFNGRAYFAGHKLVFGLAAELGLRHLHGQHASQALAHVVTGGVDLGLLGQLVIGDVFVQHASHGRTQTGKVGAAIALGDVVGKAKNSLGVAVVPLHGHVDANGGVVNDRLGTDRKHVGMQDRLAAVDVLNKALDAAQEGKVLFLALALVDQAHFYAVIQERQFAQALGQNIVVIFDVVENGGIGQEVHACALLVGGAFYLEGGDALAPIEHDFVLLALPPDGKPQPIRQCVHAGNAHAVQT